MQKSFQLELFRTHPQPADRLKKRAENQSKFFVFIKLHEKAISIVISFFIISIISFSFGVEKGKRLASRAKNQFKPEQIILINGPEDKLKEKEEKIQERRIEEERDLSKYTIQVATFKTRTYAQKEAEKLKMKGLKASVVSKGKFVIVCVGDYTRKQEAKLALIQLREIYQDCFIRRL